MTRKKYKMIELWIEFNHCRDVKTAHFWLFRSGGSYQCLVQSEGVKENRAAGRVLSLAQRWMDAYLFTAQPL